MCGAIVLYYLLAKFAKEVKNVIRENERAEDSFAAYIFTGETFAKKFVINRINSLDSKLLNQKL